MISTIEKNKLEDNYKKEKDKYDKLGVTPYELFQRQENMCWLELVYDTHEDGSESLGSLYCTNGKEYEETKNLLNPTHECVKCLSSFILRLADNTEEVNDK